MTEDTNLSRRALLGRTAAAGAAIGLAGCSSVPIIGGDDGGGGGGGDLSYGASVQGQLDESGPTPPRHDQPSETYTFSGSAGDEVVITMTSNPLDPYLTLAGPDGSYVTHDDDSMGLNSQIRTTLPSDGTYTIYASRFSGQGFFGEPTGEFTLTLERA